jgi:hypothetical protein
MRAKGAVDGLRKQRDDCDFTDVQRIPHQFEPEVSESETMMILMSTKQDVLTIA